MHYTWKCKFSTRTLCKLYLIYEQVQTQWYTVSCKPQCHKLSSSSYMSQTTAVSTESDHVFTHFLLFLSLCYRSWWFFCRICTLLNLHRAEHRKETAEWGITIVIVTHIIPNYIALVQAFNWKQKWERAVKPWWVQVNRCQSENQSKKTKIMIMTWNTWYWQLIQ